MTKTKRIIIGTIFGILGVSLMAVGSFTGFVFLMRAGIVITTTSAWVITWDK